MRPRMGAVVTERLTDAQLAEIGPAIAYSYAAGDYPPRLSAWAREWLGPDGGTLSLLKELMAERAMAGELARQVGDLRTRLAAVHKIHFQYLPVAVDFDCCAGCNTGYPIRYVPWPCDTFKALTGESE